MLTGIHILLTYSCTFECDHCFLYCTPRSAGTFTIEEIERLVDQATELESIDTVCFEGGEPLLFLPQLLAGIGYAHERGFKTGIVTNAYVARSETDADLLLSMLSDAGLDSITVSDDTFHFGDLERTPAHRLTDAAERTGRKASTISVEAPCAESPTGGVMFRGRAVDRLASSVPKPWRPWSELSTCPKENPADPHRVHVDAFGNVHFCQGISMGNVRETPLAEIFGRWDPKAHPVCGPLLEGGPAALAVRHGACEDGAYIDECHLCFEVRRHLLERFPEYLTPSQVYGR